MHGSSKTLAILCRCAGYSEPSLLADPLSFSYCVFQLLCAGPYEGYVVNKVKGHIHIHFCIIVVRQIELSNLMIHQLVKENESAEFGLIIFIS